MFFQGKLLGSITKLEVLYFMQVCVTCHTCCFRLQDYHMLHRYYYSIPNLIMKIILQTLSCPLGFCLSTTLIQIAQPRNKLTSKEHCSKFELPGMGHPQLTATAAM